MKSFKEFCNETTNKTDIPLKYFTDIGLDINKINQSIEDYSEIAKLLKVDKDILLISNTIKKYFNSTPKFDLRVNNFKNGLLYFYGYYQGKANTNIKITISYNINITEDKVIVKFNDIIIEWYGVKYRNEKTFENAKDASIYIKSLVKNFEKTNNPDDRGGYIMD